METKELKEATKGVLFGLLPLLPLLSLLSVAAVAAGPDAALMKDLSEAKLDILSSEDEKRRFMNTVALEKLRIQHRMLRGIYESAFDMYKSGNFGGAQEITMRILAIDPTFEDAVLLRGAAQELLGRPGRRLSERQMLGERFKDGLELYHENRLVEAQRKFEEVVKLSPTHLKARYWLKRVQGDLAEIHYVKGVEAYKAGRLQKTLDRWYAALLLDPGYPKLVLGIERIEVEKRQRDTNRLMQQAITLYSQGRIQDTLGLLKRILEINPGEPKAQSLLAEVSLRFAKEHVARGRKLYQKRQFQKAIRQWQRAEKFGYDKEKIRALVARGRQMIRREREAKQQREELAKRREEEKEEEPTEEKKKPTEEKKKPGVSEYKFGLEMTGAVEGSEKAKMVEGEKVISAKGGTEMSFGQKKKATEAARREALQRYQAGMVYMQNRQIEKAKYELEQAKRLDPSNIEIDAALRRIDAIIAGR